MQQGILGYTKQNSNLQLIDSLDEIIKIFLFSILYFSSTCKNVFFFSEQ